MDNSPSPGIKDQLDLVFAAYRFLYGADPAPTGTVAFITEGLAPSLRSFGIHALAFNNGIYLGNNVFFAGESGTDENTGNPIHFVYTTTLAANLYAYCFDDARITPPPESSPSESMHFYMSHFRQWLLEQCASPHT